MHMHNAYRPTFASAAAQFSVVHFVSSSKLLIDREKGTYVRAKMK